ncbi:uncharacterized protein [Clytia hemisphaerica]|uniref:uncharacterized protein n=1 Tax=Clytia hemisphaerica TaxID=252671 RepID=UPI0034D40FA3
MAGNLILLAPESPEDQFQLKIDGEELKKLAKMDVADVNERIVTFLGDFDLKLQDPDRTTKSLRVLGTRVISAMRNKNSKRQEELRRKWHFVSIQNNLETVEKTKLTTSTSKQIRTNPKSFEEIGKRQKYRRLNQIRNGINDVVGQFGFSANEIKLTTAADTQLTVTLDKGIACVVKPMADSSQSTDQSSQSTDQSSQSTDQSSQQSTSTGDESFEWKTGDDLSEIEREKAISYVLDRHTVSLKAYHELTQLAGELPRTHRVEKRLREIGDTFEIQRTEGKIIGAQCSLKDELERDARIRCAEKSVMLKVSGDGTKLTRKSNLVVLSYSVIESTGSQLKSSGNNAIGVGMGSESYECVKESFADVIKDINDMAINPKITVDGKELDVNLIIGGDYKFLLMLLGMKAATSSNACIYCDINKDDRQDPLKSGKKRTFSNWKKQPGCKDDRLLENVCLEKYIVDELHLLLRVTDRLEEGLFHTIIDQDEVWLSENAEI